MIYFKFVIVFAKHGEATVNASEVVSFKDIESLHA